MVELRAEHEAHKASKRALKLEEEVERRADALFPERERAALAEVEALRAKVGASDARIAELKADRRRWRISEELRGVARDAMLRPEALEDVELVAERELEVAADGTVSSKSGETPLAWLAAKREARPIWFAPPRRFPASSIEARGVRGRSAASGRPGPAGPPPARVSRKKSRTP